MTLEELLAREAIRKTLARYTAAGDRLNVAEFVTVFTEDAVLQSEGVNDNDLFSFSGRDAIGGWLSRWSEPDNQPAPGEPRATFVRHHLATCDIRFTSATSARVRTYWTAYTDIGPDHCGYYLDELRQEGEEWLIAHRRIRLDWRAQNSLFKTAVTRTR